MSILSKYEWIHSTKEISLYGDSRSNGYGQIGRIRFSDVLQIVIQKEDYGRIYLWDKDGSVARREDEIQIPVFGPSAHPFDAIVYVAKENTGDDDTFMISALAKKRN